MTVPAVRDAIDLLKPHLSPTTRTRLVQARVLARRPTARARLLPDFLVLGAMRAGTSTLHRYLSEHPDVGASLPKEVEYFSRYHGRGETWYRQHFPLAGRRWYAERNGRPLRVFEATPYYLFEPRCPGRVHAVLPSAQLVVLLRDPVARAFSHHQHVTRLGLEPLPFGAALEAEEGRLAADADRSRDDPAFVCNRHRHFSYFSRGLYAQQLQQWLSWYPRSNLLLVESAQLYADPAGCLDEILTFLGLRPWRPRVFGNYTYVGAAPPRSAIDAGLARDLRARFAAADRELETLWGRTPSWRSAGMGNPG
ncbi:MAG: sulfotransferase family protein [Nocardioidaceae bacterium]